MKLEYFISNCFLFSLFHELSANQHSHTDKPICKDRTKWRYVAEQSVMPQDFSIVYMSETHPELYNFITSPDGRRMAVGIPENDKKYRDACANLCLTEKDFQCRFVAFVFPYVCILAEHTNNFVTDVAFSNQFFEVPRVCLPNDGCKRVGEYFADSFSRCHFYQCSPAAGFNTLQAVQHRCPTSTLTRDNFLTSRDNNVFTQPCSVFGTECMRTFPLFAP